MSSESEVDAGKKAAMNVENALLALGLHPIPELMALRPDINYEALCLALHCSVREAILCQVARHGLLTKCQPKLFIAEVTIAILNELWCKIPAKFSGFKNKLTEKLRKLMLD